MALLLKASGGVEELRPANGRTFTLAELQAFVGGYIETVRALDGHWLVINEDGKRLQLLPNDLATGTYLAAGNVPRDVVVGDVVLANSIELGQQRGRSLMTLRDQLTDAQRAALEQTIVGALAHSGVPLHLRGGLVRYFAAGILPGGFLQAVLCNNLRETIGRGDPQSLYALPALLVFLTLHAPAVAWGSVPQVLAWTATPDRLEIEA